MSSAPQGNVNVDVAAVLQAAAQSALGIIALLCILLAGLGYGLFKGANEKYRLAVFGLAFVGAILLASVLLHEGQKQTEKKDVSVASTNSVTMTPAPQQSPSSAPTSAVQSPSVSTTLPSPALSPSPTASQTPNAKAALLPKPIPDVPIATSEEAEAKVAAARNYANVLWVVSQGSEATRNSESDQILEERLKGQDVELPAFSERRRWIVQILNCSSDQATVDLATETSQKLGFPTLEAGRVKGFYKNSVVVISSSANMNTADVLGDALSTAGLNVRGGWRAPQIHDPMNKSISKTLYVVLIGSSTRCHE